MNHESLKKMTRAAGPLVAAGIAIAVGLGNPAPAGADGAVEASLKRERCATRLSVAMLGTGAKPELMAAADPQAQVDAMLADPAFIERFSRFVNAKLNAEPGAKIAEDASYTLASYVLTNGKAWKEMFVGQYDVTDVVTANPNGLGYFRSDAWMKRYAGNELAGYRIVSAYRILQNTTGLKLTATTNVDGLDLSVAGRQSPACAGCHFDGWYALDKVARVLSKRQGMGANMKFIPPTDGPQQILGGQTINDDKELVTALVDSDSFKVSSCRLAFEFLYGRDESTCEAQVFDACIDAFTAKGTMQSALAAVAKDPSFCQ